MNEYLNNKLLEMIKKWDVVKNGIHPLVDLIIDNWHWEDYVSLKGNILKLSTGGWSGNEEIINVLRENFGFWHTCWIKTERGGHYTFNLHHYKENKHLIKDVIIK